MSTPVQGQGASVEATATPSGVTTDVDARSETGEDENWEAVRRQIIALQQKYERETQRFWDEPDSLGYVAGEWIACFSRDLRALAKLTEVSTDTPNRERNDRGEQ